MFKIKLSNSLLAIKNPRRRQTSSLKFAGKVQVANY